MIKNLWTGNSSDTPDDLSDSNMSADQLFQDRDGLPDPLQNDHIKEGLIHNMTRHSERKNALLVLIIEATSYILLPMLFSAEICFQDISSYWKGDRVRL